MLRGIWALLVLVFVTLVCSLATIVGVALAPRFDVPIRMGGLWSRVMLRAVGVRAEYEGLEHSRPDGPCVFVSNHQSIVDIWAVTPVLPRSALFVAKHSLFRIPVLGWAMRMAGFIPIDRQRLGKAIRSLGSAEAQLRGGRPVILFPEGTRSRDGRLATFKKGAFHLALGARVPVVPIAISGSWDVIRPRAVRVRPGTVRVTFSEPIAIEPFLPDNVRGLLGAVRKVIAHNLEPVERAADDPVLQAETR